MVHTKYWIVDAGLREFGVIGSKIEGGITVHESDQPLIDWRDRVNFCLECIRRQFSINVKGINLLDSILVEFDDPQANIEINDNPLIQSITGNWFGAIPFDKIKEEHFLPAIKRHHERSLNFHEKCVTNPEEPSFYNTLGHGIEDAALNDDSSLNAKMILSILNYSNTTEGLDKIQEESIKLYNENVKPKLAFDRRSYDRCFHVLMRTKWLPLNDAENRILLQTIEAGKRAGFDLPQETKDEILKISDKLSLLAQKYRENCRKESYKVIKLATKDELTGLPQRLLDFMKVEENGETRYKLTANRAVAPEVLAHCSNREIRKEVYQAYHTRNLGGEFDNTKICVDIANLKLKLAQLYGFKSVADMALSRDRMLNSADKVYDFLNKLVAPVKAKAAEETNQLMEFIAKIEGSDFVVEPWDYSYYAKKLKESLFNMDMEKVREYFVLENLIRGLFQVATNLYGIEFRVIDVPVYHEDIVAYQVYEKVPNTTKERFLGILYLDLYCRDSKSTGAWAADTGNQGILKVKDSITGKTIEYNNRPHVFLNTNFMKGNPTLLSLDDVETLFHEFGHALQALLSDVEYECQCCNDVSLDYVELASQFMEHYATNPSFLNVFAKHYQTGEALPSEILEKIVKSNNFRSGNAVLRQLYFDFLDLKWYTATTQFNIETEEDIIKFENEALSFLNEGVGLKAIKNKCISTAFSHIFGGGYTAGYYSYMWTDVLSADAYAYFVENGVFNPTIAKSFRDNILSKGDSEDPMKLYIRFRGKEPEVEALLKEKEII